MSQKMGADVEDVLNFISGACPVEAQVVRAHIAAVEAERDEAVRDREDLESNFSGLNGAEVLSQLRTLESERDALRERVKALESDLEDKRALITKWKESARQLVERGERVCPEPSTVQGAHKLGTNSEEDEASDDVQRQRDREGWEKPKREKGEPTTAEAFATVRDGLAEKEMPFPDVSRLHRAESALSLLERRMGAQQRAIQMMLRLHEQGLAGSHYEDVFRELRLSLTDAPPVFTLEDNPLRPALLKALEYIGDRSAGSGEAWVAAIRAMGMDEDSTAGEVLVALRR